MSEKTQYRIMKLRSGEELITKIVSSTGKKLTLERPMCFKSIMIQDYFGNPKEILVMKNWIPLSEGNKIEIPSDHVISFNVPNSEAIKIYDLEKQKEDGKLNNIAMQKELEDDEEFKKMLKFLAENTEKLDEKMKDVKNLPEDKNSNNKEDMIFMNMMFPPEMLVDLIESEIIDPEIFGEMYMDMKKNMKKKKKPEVPKNKKTKKDVSEGSSDKYTGNDKSHKDFGNRWTDWNPDLSSEDYK